MKNVLSTFIALALLACAEGPNAPSSPASYAAKAAVVDGTTITATVSNSRRGKWLTSAGLGLAVDGDLSIDRIGRYNYNGLRIQLSRSGSDGFSDHWSKGDPLKMTLTVDGTDVSFSLSGVGGSWAAWTIDDSGQAGIIEGIETGDSFTFSISTASTVEPANEQSSKSCIEQLVDLYRPASYDENGKFHWDSDYDRDVWEDSYDSCEVDIMLSGCVKPTLTVPIIVQKKDNYVGGARGVYWLSAAHKNEAEAAAGPDSDPEYIYIGSESQRNATPHPKDTEISECYPHIRVPDEIYGHRYGSCIPYILEITGYEEVDNPNCDEDSSSPDPLTDCERLACYKYANCMALGESGCVGASLR